MSTTRGRFAATVVLAASGLLIGSQVSVWVGVCLVIASGVLAYFLGMHGGAQWFATAALLTTILVVGLQTISNSDDHSSATDHGAPATSRPAHCPGLMEQNGEYSPPGCEGDPISFPLLPVLAFAVIIIPGAIGLARAEKRLRPGHPVGG